MSKQLPLDLPAVKPLVEVRLFEMRIKEPFYYMYGFGHAWGYRMTELQARLMKQRRDREIFYSAGLDLGKAVKAGLKPTPEWATIHEPDKEVSIA